MAELWFWLIALVLAGYVVLDGFDLGVGVLHLFIAKNDEERRAVLQSIGPVWDGNEVWLLAAGGSLFCAFPKLYATAVSGFYLPIMVVMWLLVFRALGIEMRHQLHHPLWDQAWDVAFAGASTLLAVGFGAALGAIVRGVSFDENGRFFAPLWTSLWPSEPAGLLDVYTIPLGVTATLVLALHGSLWIAHRVDGPPCERARAWSPKLALAAGLSILGMTALTFAVRPTLKEALAQRTWGYGFALLAAVAFAACVVFIRRKSFMRAFLASSVFAGAMILNAASAVYPYVLIAIGGDAGMTLEQAASPDATLRGALYWWVPGMTLAILYSVWVYRRLPLSTIVGAPRAAPGTVDPPRSGEPAD